MGLLAEADAGCQTNVPEKTSAADSAFSWETKNEGKEKGGAKKR